MRPRTLTFTNILDDSATNYIMTAEAHTANVAFTTLSAAAGANSTDGLAHLVIITPSGSVSGNYDLVGTCADGKPQTETLATNAANAVTTLKYWMTVTSITPSFTDTDTAIAGITDDAVSPTIMVDGASPYPARVQFDFTGTGANFDVEETTENVLALGVSAGRPNMSLAASSPAQNALFTDHAGLIESLVSFGVDIASDLNQGVTAFRLKLNSAADSTTDLRVLINQATRS